MSNKIIEFIAGSQSKISAAYLVKHPDASPVDVLEAVTNMGAAIISLPPFRQEDHWWEWTLADCRDGIEIVHEYVAPKTAERLAQKPKPRPRKVIGGKKFT